MVKGEKEKIYGEKDENKNEKREAEVENKKYCRKWY